MAVTVYESTEALPERLPPQEPLPEYDPEDVAAWCLRQRWLPGIEDDPEWQRREFLPQLVRLYLKERPKELEREAAEAERRRKRDEMWAEAERSRQRAADHAYHMKQCRLFGEANGFRVGTRGPIPKKVRDAYKAQTGVEL
ncbi:hypothetical protein [Kitasatospora cineracea]|uniref:hypothetical protein n=1 Tax=Kitasatospora cineracea TaxID=88074 RepID=UPI0033FE3D9B